MDRLRQQRVWFGATAFEEVCNVRGEADVTCVLYGASKFDNV